MKMYKGPMSNFISMENELAFRSDTFSFKREQEYQLHSIILIKYRSYSLGRYNLEFDDNKMELAKT
jgi:hypothetical protein